MRIRKQKRKNECGTPTVTYWWRTVENGVRSTEDNDGKKGRQQQSCGEFQAERREEKRTGEEKCTGVLNIIIRDHKAISMTTFVVFDIKAPLHKPSHLFGH